VSDDDLSKLARWFARHCDGTWEQHRGISVQSTDNPGWWVKIDLTRTALEVRPFAEVSEGVDDKGFPTAARWLHCHLQDEQWHGAGDPTRLPEIISRFLAWAG
jgi:hypothetical protein